MLSLSIYVRFVDLMSFAFTDIKDTKDTKEKLDRAILLIDKLRDQYIQIKEGEWIAIYEDGTHKIGTSGFEVVSGCTESCYSVHHRADFKQEVRDKHTGDVVGFLVDGKLVPIEPVKEDTTGNKKTNGDDSSKPKDMEE